MWSTPLHGRTNSNWTKKTPSSLHPWDCVTRHFPMVPLGRYQWHKAGECQCHSVTFKSMLPWLQSWVLWQTTGLWHHPGIEDMKDKNQPRNLNVRRFMPWNAVCLCTICSFPQSSIINVHVSRVPKLWTFDKNNTLTHLCHYISFYDDYEGDTRQKITLLGFRYTDLYELLRISLNLYLISEISILIFTVFNN